MPLSCHGALQRVKGDTNFTFALAGNPNVGKSSFFNRLTGLGVVTANYPGKTVEINLASTTYDGLAIGIIDLPGTYAIGAISEDQWVARRGVLDGQPDVAIMVVDATNLARNLYMVLQFLDLNLPLVLALNIVDQAEKRGVRTDIQRLSDLLGVPVVPTVAVHGQGLNEVMQAAVGVAKRNGSCCQQSRPPAYGKDVEEVIDRLSRRIEPLAERPYNLSPRGLAILLLEGDTEFRQAFESLPGGPEMLVEAERIGAQLGQEHGEPAPIRMARERHGLAGAIASQVQTRDKRGQLGTDRLWRLTTSPVTGLPILLLVLASIFAFLFYVGSFLSTILTDVWSWYISPVLDGGIFFIFGQGVIGKTLIWGPDAGIAAALAVGIPYVLTFYFLLAFMEDTGYLNSVAFLTDQLMHKVGLHGRAMIPLVAGAGCNVPAIIGTRVLSTMRERVIASILIVLVPCSARTAVILGAVFLYAGWLPAITIYLIVLVLVIAVGVGLNKMMPGRSSGLVMEMFPFRAPSLPTIAKKTWFRFKDFVFVALPIVLGGSLVLGALYESGYLWLLTNPLSPVVEGWLGLPAVAGLTLVFAVLRKELALQLLVTFAIVKYGQDASNLLHFMNTNQLFVYALVNTIYIPCVATIAVLGKELGWRRAILIMIFTIGLAVVTGGVATHVLQLFA